MDPLDVLMAEVERYHEGNEAEAPWDWCNRCDRLQEIAAAALKMVDVCECPKNLFPEWAALTALAGERRTK